MQCPNENCDCHGVEIRARNREEDGSLTTRYTCPSCGTHLVSSAARTVNSGTQSGLALGRPARIERVALRLNAELPGLEVLRVDAYQADDQWMVRRMVDAIEHVYAAVAELQIAAGGVRPEPAKDEESEQEETEETETLLSL